MTFEILKEVRWGIIGCGNVTEVKSGPAFNKIPGSTLVAVMRRDAQKAADYARRHHVPRWFSDADQLINDPEVNAIYIATPPSSHKEYIVAAAIAGKAVYVEKPMAHNAKDCLQMREACIENNVPLFVAYYRRAQPRFLKIKSLLDSGAIGEPRAVTITLFRRPVESDIAPDNWRVQPEIAGGGYFVDLASHTIDLLQYLLGDIRWVSGISGRQMGRYPAEDAVCAAFCIGKNVQATGIWNFNTFTEVDRNEIVGSNGKITFATFLDQPVILETNDGVQRFEIPQPQHVQQPLIETIVAELMGKGKCPSTGETAENTNSLMEIILKSVKK